MIDHDRARFLAAAAADGPLPEPSATELANHLRSCAACRADADGYVRDRAALASLLTLDTEPVDPRVRRSVERAAAGRRPARPWFVPLVAALGLLILAALAVFAVGQMRPNPSPSSTPSSSRSPSDASATWEDITFVPQAFTVGFAPMDVDVGDIDLDGDLDIITGSEVEGGTLSQLRGDGQGSFSGLEESFANHPKRLHLADLDLDGDLDAAVANPGPNSIATLRNDGIGPIGAPATILVDDGPQDVVIADFDADGLPDLATPNAVSNTISVLVGEGTGTFRSLEPMPMLYGPHLLTAADFDADGAIDLAVGTAGDPRVALMLGRGDGTFDPPRFVGGTFDAEGLATGDVDGDGDVDLVVSNDIQDELALVLMDPAGLTWEVRFVDTARAFIVGPGEVVVADMDRDGVADLVVASFGGEGVEIHRGLGGGVFDEPRLVPGGRRPSGLIVRDVNGDGGPDIITSNQADDAVGVLLWSADE